MSTMHLWTPYADEAALDLRKAPVKTERVTPPQILPSPIPREYYPYSQYPTYPAVTTVTSQISPASGSSCSFDETYSNRATLSPPDSAPETRIYNDSLSDDPEFQAFERDAMRAMAEKNGGSLLGNNPRMRRAVKSTIENASDKNYITQRQRNNQAAKQSRDRRKLREIRLALKATFLENEVARLKAQLATRYCPSCQRQCFC